VNGGPAQDRPPPTRGGAPGRVGLMAIAAYFLRLGTTGFGGPIALSARMERDLVETRGWVSREEFLEGLALAQLAPGPLAAQLAIYLGWLRAGLAGATLVGVAFVLPSFVLVLACAALYVRFGGLPWIQAAFYGIGAAVIAVIALGARKLMLMTLGRDAQLWLVCAINLIATALSGREIIWIFLASGVLVPAVRTLARRPIPASLLALAPLASPWLLAGAGGSEGTATLLSIALYFATAGAFVFGSGLAIVPFLHGGVVGTHHWLTERQFIDAVAVAMITPGPVVITVAFIGFLVAGFAGATAAAAGVFVPCYLFVVVLAPAYRQLAHHAGVKAFVAGVTAAACGALAGAVIVLGRRAIHDLPTIAIALVTLALLVRFRRLSEPIVILLAGVVGMLLRPRGL
jgi:chromate transporter